MNKRYAQVAYSCLFMAAACIFSCSKKDSGNAGGPGSASGSLSTGSSSPSNVWLSGFTTAAARYDTIFTALSFSSGHTVSRVITTTKVGINSTYTTLLPVYTAGQLTELLDAPDSTASTGTLNTQFDYTASGQLRRIRYHPGAPGYTYDSIVLNQDNVLQSTYHFIPAGPSGTLTEIESALYTWSSQHDIISVLFNDYDTTAGTWTASTVQYQFDGSYNPYQTVKDLPLILGGINNVSMLSANNPTDIVMVGLPTGINYLYTYNAQSFPTSSDEALIQQTVVKSSIFTYFQYIE
jgi:hypothetical protein